MTRHFVFNLVTLKWNVLKETRLYVRDFYISLGKLEKFVDDKKRKMIQSRKRNSISGKICKFSLEQNRFIRI